MTSSTSGTGFAGQHGLLLELAARSIESGLRMGGELPVDLADYPASLTEFRASFVTLRKRGRLRGCIGSVEPIRPLALDIARNAFAAAFRDPRFPPLAWREFRTIRIHLSLLTPPEPLEFQSEDDLLAQIRPGVDGLVLQEADHRSTLIPAVWDMERDPRRFLQHLKRKAGLPPDYWSETIRVKRYRAESVA